MKSVIQLFWSVWFVFISLFADALESGPWVAHFAKVKFLHWSGASGSEAGTTYSRNKGGAYIRSRAIPTNPQTAAQTIVRNRLGTLAAAWRGLTQAERDAWNTAVANFPTVNVFGDVRELTGLQLYVGINVNRLNIGLGSLAVPPAPVGADGLDSLALTSTVAGPTFDVAYTPDPVPADHELVVQATVSLSAGISNANNKFRQIATVAAAAASPFLGGADYDAKFGAPVAGMKVFTRCYFIRNSTGEVSLKLQAEDIVV